MALSGMMNATETTNDPANDTTTNETVDQNNSAEETSDG